MIHEHEHEPDLNCIRFYLFLKRRLVFGFARSKVNLYQERNPFIKEILISILIILVGKYSIGKWEEDVVEALCLVCHRR